MKAYILSVNGEAIEVEVKDNEKDRRYKSQA